MKKAKAKRPPKKPKRHNPEPQRKEPLWKGPQEDGITFSLLSKWLVCPERFRLMVVEGLVEPEEKFPHALEYGSLWHEAEEAYAGGNDWKAAVRKYSEKLRAEYPADDKEIAKWTYICLCMFPEYTKFWKRDRMEKQRQPVLEEVAFRVPYQLPSGRWLTLRGKWDCVFMLGKFLWLQENKTKGNIDEEGITATVSKNLQSMLYQIALRVAYDPKTGAIDTGGEYVDTAMGLKHSGTLYNVIRRPLSDRYSPKQRKKENDRDFWKRASVGQVEAKKPAHWFKRWKVNIPQRKLETFKRETFDPLLERLLDWWEWVAADPFNPWEPRRAVIDETDAAGILRLLNASEPTPKQHCLVPNAVHWMFPWGVYNSIAGGWRGDYFETLAKGNRHGLVEKTTLFPELE